MSMLRSVLTYMGLGPDEDYDDGYLYQGDSPAQETDSERSIDDATIDVRDHAPDPHSLRRRPDWLDPGSTSTSSTRRTGRRRLFADGSNLSDAGKGQRGNHDFDGQESDRPLRAVPPSEFHSAGDGITVRSVTSTPDRGGAGDSSASSGPRQVKPRALSPQSFGEAKILADEFKNSVPVIMNLQGIERDLARRLIDFASGICYALDGGMEKIASHVFLITPQSVEISEEDRRRIEQRGYED